MSGAFAGIIRIRNVGRRALAPTNLVSLSWAALAVLALASGATASAQICPDSPSYSPTQPPGSGSNGTSTGGSYGGANGGGNSTHSASAGGGQPGSGTSGGGASNNGGVMGGGDPGRTGGGNGSGPKPTHPTPTGTGTSNSVGGVTRGGAAIAAPSAGGRGLGGAAPGKTKRNSDGIENWVTWWNFNKYELMNVRRMLDDAGHRTGTTAGLDGEEVVDTDLRRWLAVPTLGRVLRCDRNPLPRVAAAIALGKSGEKEAFGHLVPALHDDDLNVARAAALSIGLLGRPEGLQILADILEDTRAGRAMATTSDAPVSEWVRQGAALGLGFMGDHRAAPILVRSLDGDAAPAIRVFVAQALGILGDGAVVPALCRHLADDAEETRVRASCAIALGRIRDGGASVQSILARALGERSHEIVRAATIALGITAKPTDDGVLKALISLVDTHQDQVVRALALVALGRIGGDTAAAACREKLGRKGALTGFGPIALALSARTDEEVAAAREALSASYIAASSNDARGAHCIAFGLVHDRSKAAELLRLAQSGSDPELRSYALEGIAMIGECPDVRALVRLLHDEHNPRLRHAAALAVGSCGMRGAAVAELVATLQDGSAFVRGACSLALGFIGNRDAAHALMDIATRVDVPADARAAAACALGLLCDHDGVPLFQRLRASNLFHEDTPELRDVLFLL